MKRAASAPEWSVESRHCGTVTSNDVPRLMKKLLREEFPSKIATRLSQPNEVLKLYAKGEQKMGELSARALSRSWTNAPKPRKKKRPFRRQPKRPKGARKLSKRPRLTLYHNLRRK